MDKFTFKEHFASLKICLMKIFFAYICFFIISYYFSENLFQLVLTPLFEAGGVNQKIIYTDLTEAFISYIRISSYSSLILIYPFCCYQFFVFIRPGLYSNEKKMVLYVICFSPLLFYLGIIFLYYLIIPNAWLFFTSYSNNSSSVPLILEAKISEYLSLFLSLVCVFGISFQLPIILSILSILNLVSSNQLREKRRIVIVIIFIIAALFTPPDIFSQIALAIPLISLYEISIVISKTIENKVEEKC